MRLHITKFFDTAEKLELSPAEHDYLAIIANLQNDPKREFWAEAANEYYAKLLRITARGVQKISKRLCEKGLLTKGKGSRKRATNKFLDLHLGRANTNSVRSNSTAKDEQSSPLKTNKVHVCHEQSSPNKDININNNKTLKERVREEQEKESKRIEAIKAERYKPEIEKRKEWLESEVWINPFKKVGFFSSNTNLQHTLARSLKDFFEHFITHDLNKNLTHSSVINSRARTLWAMSKGDYHDAQLIVDASITYKSFVMPDWKARQLQNKPKTA